MMNQSKQQFPIKDLLSGEYSLLIPGPSGSLESQISIPAQVRNDYLAIICHPHSLYGGTMQNKVVTTLARVFRDQSIPTVRFNFRGVGQSSGEFDQGLGETEDLRAVIQWVNTQNPNLKLCLAGFSFGSFVAYRASHDRNCALLITVAPPIHHFNYDLAYLPKAPWIIVQGEKDEIVPAEQVFTWADSLPVRPFVLRFPDVDHFFNGKLLLLRDQLQPLIASYLQ
jgi:alpha/beta superfamily hydrolase